MQNLVFGILYGLVAQIVAFLQLQGGIKWEWYPKYQFLLYALSLPLTWMYLKSVRYFIDAFDGEIWPSRLIGFSIGIIVFTLMSHYIFKEPLSFKTIVCLLLGFSIVAIQILWR